MQFIMDMMQQDWINSLGWTLLHSLWQCALIAVFCGLLLFFTKNLPANARYLIASTSLILCTVISVITFYRYQQAHSEIIIKPSEKSSIVQTFTEENVFNLIDVINDHINILVIGWLLGFSLYSVKIFLDYRYCQRLKNQYLIATPEKWQPIFKSLVRKVGITSKIDLRISTITSVPCVIGHFKPVILIPMGLLLGMSQQQIEVILLHELAHVRRHDYLFGLIQAVLRIAFFFNPFLHWISHQIDKEREHACDDIAVTISQDPLLFATTLKEFANMNIKQQPAMNVTGNKLLLTRITRLFSKNEHAAQSKNKFIAAILIIFSSLLITLCVNAEPERAADKIISIDIDNAPVKEVMDQANKKCGTNETVTPGIGKDKITLHIKDIKCSEAMTVIKSFPGTAKEKQVTMHLSDLPLKTAMEQVNQQCGSNETISDKNSAEKIHLNFEEVSCDSIITMLKNFDK